MKHSYRTGFTLLELSIVLVVIGLVVAGIVVGQSLLRNAQTRNVLSEMQKHITAISSFRDKYYALPGDFAGATALWGSSGAVTTAGTPPATWNGDGNGRITTQATNTTFYEQFRAWQHLANAGMVEGDYTGIASSANTQLRSIGVNVPASQLDGAGWGVVTIVAGEASSDMPYNTGDIPPNTVLWFGGSSSSSYSSQNYMQPVLTAEEARQIDEKTDDAIPTMGKVVAQINATGTACYSSNAYSLTTSGRICALVFKTGL